MNSKRPNLFCYATKELSQDAMICWLIACAGSSEDKELRRCGRRFVNALLNHKRGEKKAIELESVITTRIRQQERGIDVLARINDKHVLLIEDKTDTKDHSGQLERYYGDVVEHRTSFGEVLEADLHPIYFKTGNQSLADDHRIEGIKDYKVFHRKDLLEVLMDYGGDDSILRSFRQYLQKLECETNRYTAWTREGNRESWRAWEGLFRCLECEMKTNPRRSKWEYVPNPSGGFLSFWWGESDNDAGWGSDDELYLQIEAYLERGARTNTKLCFKVDCHGKSDRQQQALKRDCWHKRVLKMGRGRVEKPARLGIGNTMTVGLWKDDWMAFGNDKKLDLSGTVENLKEAEEVLKAAISSGSRHPVGQDERCLPKSEP